MLPDHVFPSRDADNRPTGGCAELLCLLRLSEIALAGAQPEAGVRAMIDEIARFPDIFRAMVALPEASGGRLRYLAHFGVPGLAAHAPLTREPSPMVAQVVATRELVQLTRSDGGPSHACVNVPILGGSQLLGILGIGLRRTVPLNAWTEHVMWAAADLIALVLLNDRSTADDVSGAIGDGGKLGLTRRQGDVIFLLVDRGASNAQIAAELGLSARTVKIHLQAAYRHLGVRRRGDAIRTVLTKHGDWLELERGRRRNGRVQS